MTFILEIEGPKHSSDATPVWLFDPPLSASHQQCISRTRFIPCRYPHTTSTRDTEYIPVVHCCEPRTRPSPQASAMPNSRWGPLYNLEDADCVICGLWLLPLQVLVCSIHPDRERKTDYGIFGVHLTCDIDLVHETNREKTGRMIVRIQSE